MKLKDITAKDITKVADSDAILARGWRYHLNGMIKSMKLEDDSIIAKVKGNYGTYNVKIYIDVNDEIEGDCDCPYDRWGCKHIVAVLYKWLNEKKDLLGPLAKESSDDKHTIFHKLTLDKIAENTSKVRLSEAFKLVENNSVQIKSLLRDKLIAEVNDQNNFFTVVIEPSYSPYDNGFFCRCSCGHDYGSNSCKHPTAALVAVFLQLNKDKSLSEYKERIKDELHKERYDSFVNDLDSIDKDEIQVQKYHFFFTVEKTINDISIAIKKALILKRGGIGKPSCVSIKMLENHYDSMPENKKKTFQLFIISLKAQRDYMWYSSNDKLTKKEFKTPLDFELLERLRDLYMEDINCFSGCTFPYKKADVEIIVKEKNKQFAFKFDAIIDEKRFRLNKNNIKIIDESLSWIYTYDKEKEIFLLFELNCKHPEVLHRVISNSDVEIKSEELRDFIENYYLKLSSIGKVILPDEHDVEEKAIEPRPRIFLKDFNDIFSVELRFLYGSEEVEYSNRGDMVFRDDKNRIIKIKRNREGEEKYYSDLLDNNLMERNNVLVPSTDAYDWLADSAKNLISLGYEIFGADKLFNQKINVNEPNLTIEVSSGIDWFDMKGGVNFGDENVPLDNMMQALSKHERFIKLSDGSRGVIPNKWLKKLSGVMGLLESDKEQGTIKASSAQIAIIEALLDIAGKAKVDKKFSEMRERFKHFREIKDAPLPKKFRGELRDYQKAGYNWLNFLQEFSFGGCLADEMGLGKTVQVLSLLLYRKEQGCKAPSLIIVPTSLVFNWENEVKKFTPSLEVYVHHGINRLKSINKIMKQKPNLIITTYGTLRNDIKIFKKKMFHYVVLDESQHIKNPLAKSTKCVYSLKSEHKLVISGTPIENSSIDLWSQFAFLNPGLLGDLNYFKQTFAQSVEKNKDKNKIESLKNMINPFLLSRKKATVAKDLPDKQITTLYCEMDTKQRKIYDYWKSRFQYEIKNSIQEKGFGSSKMKILQGLMKLRQICNHPALVDESYSGNSGKFDTMISQIEEVINSGHKVLIYSSFVKMLRIFKDYLSKQNIRFSYLDGSTRNRQEVVEDFQENDDIKAFLISLKAGGLGLNLTAADYVFIIDPWWNPAAEMQAIDRTHRIGQKKNIFVYKAITKDSIEEKILALQEEKLDMVKNIITVESGIFKKLNNKDVHKLFE